MMKTQRPNTIPRYAFILCAVAGITAAAVEYWPTRNPLDWMTLERAKVESKKTGKPVFFDLYADWCQPCRIMDKTVFSNDTVAHVLQTKYVLARQNIDDPAFTDSIKKAIHLRAIPTSIVYNSNGKELRRWIGFMSTTELLERMQDSLLLAFGGWEDFHEGLYRSRREQKPLAVLVLHTKEPLEQFQETFSTKSVLQFVSTNFATSMLIEGLPPDKYIIDSLGVRTSTIPQGGGLILVFNAKGKLTAQLPLEWDVITDEKLLVDALEPYKNP